VNYKGLITKKDLSKFQEQISSGEIGIDSLDEVTIHALARIGIASLVDEEKRCDDERT